MHARFLTRVAAALVLALTCPSAAGAEWHFVPTIGWTFGADTNLIDLDHGTSKVHWNFGGSVALLGAGIFGVEGMIGWTPGFFTNDDVALMDRIVTKSRTVTMMGNAVLTTPRNWTEYGLRPFVSGGFGVLGVSAPKTCCPRAGTLPHSTSAAARLDSSPSAPVSGSISATTTASTGAKRAAQILELGPGAMCVT